jgi:hypothetical protein
MYPRLFPTDFQFGRNDPIFKHGLAAIAERRRRDELPLVNVGWDRWINSRTSDSTIQKRQNTAALQNVAVIRNANSLALCVRRCLNEMLQNGV